MAIHRYPINNHMVLRLFEFTSTPFRLRDFQAVWKRLGWSYTPTTGDEYGFRVSVDTDWPFIIDPLGERIVAAILPFFYWDDYDPAFRKDLAVLDQERSQFESEFDSVAKLAEGLLSAPLCRWQDADKSAHRAMVWAGKDGVLVLQQADFDLQFGRELNFWLAPIQPGEFTPSTPLIDWLCQYSRAVHEKLGFPPLIW
jgi:hypothetical protein